MPFIIYSNVRGKGKVDFDAADAVKYYTRHYENWLILCSIYASSQSKDERRQANSEIRIAQRKMDFWVRHKNFDPFRCARAMRDVRIDRAKKHINLE